MMSSDDPGDGGSCAGGVIGAPSVDTDIPDGRFGALDLAVRVGSDVVACGAAKALPGVAVAVVVSGKTVHTTASGVCRLGSMEPVDSDTMFLTASISKTLVAIACLQAVERGELDLDMDIRDMAQRVAIPHSTSRDAGVGFDTAGASAVATIAAAHNPHFPGAPLTPRHLLTHTAGLRDDETALMPGSFRVDGTDFPDPLHAYVARRLLPGGADYDVDLWTPDAPPGSVGYSYSNAGFTLLGAALEVATGTSLHDLANTRIFEPLAMSRSTFSLVVAQDRGDDHLASPHRARRPLSHYAVAEWPAAQLRSTAKDLSRLLCALTAPPGQCPLLAPASLAAMLPESGTQGLAWWGRDATYSCRESGLWEHGGFMDGVRTHIYLWPDLSSGAVILTNGTGDYVDIERAVKCVVREDDEDEAIRAPASELHDTSQSHAL